MWWEETSKATEESAFLKIFTENVISTGLTAICTSYSELGITLD